MYYPIFLNLSNKRCVVIGGGEVAKRKVSALLKTGSSIILISPNLCPELKRLVSHHEDNIIYHNRNFKPKDLKTAFLVIGATNNRIVNSKIFSYCQKRNILVNIVDSPSESNFIVPSVVRQGDLVLAISTGGISPALAKNIRKELSVVYGPEYARLLIALKDARSKIIKDVPCLALRHRILSRIAQKDMVELAKKTKRQDVLKKKILNIIADLIK